MTAFPNLLSPAQIGRIEVRNRVVFTAHGAFLDFYKPSEPPERYVGYQERRAAGGAGLIILQPVHVHPSSHAMGHHTYDPDDLRAKLTLIGERLHAHGAKVLIQLMHFGAEFNTDARLDLQPLWGFSPLTSPTGAEVAHEMTPAEIEEVVDGFARTAAIAIEAGLDGVEVHATHGYLVQQSFSPWGNRRTDEWGEPRRFVTAVLERIRAAVGAQPVVSLRMSVDDFLPEAAGGLGPKGLRGMARSFAETRLLDLVNTSAGARSAHYAKAVASYQHPHGLFLPLDRELRAELAGLAPVIGVGRITTPELAEEAVRDGFCDLVAMTRAQIADPELVRKLQTGERARVRPCVGANQGCVDRMVGALPITCFHNPDVGREHRLGELEPASPPLDVLVVGGGPAGMKAAEVAARRGHRVVLAERDGELGGRLRLATTYGRASELGGALDWLRGELALFDVDVRLGNALDARAIVAAAPDAVVLATGAVPAPDALDPGDDSVPVWSTDRAMGEDPSGRRILVVDHLGTHEAAQAAERLAALGGQVTIVTPFPSFGPKIGFTQLAGQLRRLADHGCRLEVGTKLVGIAGGEVTTETAHFRERITRPFDAVVAGVPARADDHLRAPLEAAGLRVLLAGDAVAPRNAMLAFREGDNAGRAL